MVLFKCDLKEAKSYADEVFTFHYGPIQIKVTQNANECDKLIYIPLWSYSNISQDILILLMNWFTFHYGPIQMSCFTLASVISMYLHSTMVLFK